MLLNSIALSVELSSSWRHPVCSGDLHYLLAAILQSSN
jgi:hypothetical protein